MSPRSHLCRIEDRYRFDIQLVLTPEFDPSKVRKSGTISEAREECQMPKKRYTDEQIAFALRQAEGGTPVGEICRKMGVTEATYYRLRKAYAGMGVAEIRRVKQIEEENAKLKRLVADLSLDKTMLQDVRRSEV